MTLASGSAQLCRWVDSAACAARLDLPWIADPECIRVEDRHAMGAVCSECPVLAACAASADALEAPAGWWAGRHRDPAPVVWEQGALDWPAVCGFEVAA